MLVISSFYFAVYLFFYLLLTCLVIRRRWEAKVSLGDGGDQTLNLRQRAHGNFQEYAPFFLLGFFFLENHLLAHKWGLGNIFLHLLGASFFLARISHAYGILRCRFRPRFYGTLFSLLLLVLVGIILFFSSFVVVNPSFK